MKRSSFLFPLKGILWAGALAVILFACDSAPVTQQQAAPKEDHYNGIRKTFREGGSLFAEVSYKDSVRDGLARNYYPNGTLQLEMTYVKGLKQGEAYYYYDDGQLYQVTNYVDDLRQGIQKKYHRGNILMAEVPFKDNKQMPGMKEYSKSGKLITKDVRLVFTVVDKTAFEDKFDLVVHLSDGSKIAQYERLLMDEGGELMATIKMNTFEGKAMESYYIPPGGMLNQRIRIRAERKTYLGNTEVFEDSYNLQLENKKRFY
jgi:hypothetical protein